MKTLTIRGLPDEVHARLKERAKQNRRSLNQEVIDALVTKNLEKQDSNSRVRELLAAADKLREGVKEPLSIEEIIAARDIGRK